MYFYFVLLVAYNTFIKAGIESLSFTMSPKFSQGLLVNQDSTSANLNGIMFTARGRHVAAPRKANNLAPLQMILLNIFSITI